MTKLRIELNGADPAKTTGLTWDSVQELLEGLTFTPSSGMAPTGPIPVFLYLESDTPQKIIDRIEQNSVWPGSGTLTTRTIPQK